MKLKVEVPKVPYIKQEDRHRLHTNYSTSWTGPVRARNAGELNYVFTYICTDYVDHVGKSYQTYNDVIGALEACKLELYRRVVALYEDEKCKLNGDVFK